MPGTFLNFFSSSAHKNNVLADSLQHFLNVIKIESRSIQLALDNQQLPLANFVQKLKSFHSFNGEHAMPPRYYSYMLKRLAHYLKENTLLNKDYLNALQNLENNFEQQLKKNTRLLVAYFAQDLWQTVNHLKMLERDQVPQAIKLLRQSLKFYKTLLPNSLYKSSVGILDKAAYDFIFKTNLNFKTWQMELLNNLELMLAEELPTTLVNSARKMGRNVTRSSSNHHYAYNLFKGFLALLSSALPIAQAQTNHGLLQTLPARRNTQLIPLSNQQTLMVWQSVTTLNAALLDQQGNLLNNVLSQETTDPAVDWNAMATPQGGFVIVWSQNQQQIQGQIFNSQGVSTQTLSIQGQTGNSLAPALVRLTDHSFLVAWQQQPTANASVLKGQIYNFAGVPQGNLLDPLIPSSNDFQTTPALASIPSQNQCLITWSVRGKTINVPARVYAQLLDAQGNPSAQPPIALGDNINQQLQPVCAALTQGQFLVAWQQTLLNSSNSNTYACVLQLQQGQLSFIQPAFAVSQTDSQTTNQAAEIIPLTNGNGLIHWLSQSSSDPSQNLLAQLVTPTGQLYGQTSTFETVENNQAVLPTLSPLTDTSLLLSAEQNNQISTSILNTQITVTNLNQSISYYEDEAYRFVKKLQLQAEPFINQVTVTLTLSDSAAGVISNQASADLNNIFLPASNWTISGSLAMVNQALAALQFKPNPGYYKNFTIFARIDDGFSTPLQGNINALGNAQDIGPQLKNPIPDQELQAGQPFKLMIPDNAFSDNYNDIVAYEAFLTNGESLSATKWLNFSPTDRTFSGVPPRAEQIAISIRAIDSRNLSKEDSFNLNIKNSANLILGLTLGLGVPCLVILLAGIFYSFRRNSTGKGEDIPLMLMENGKNSKINNGSIEKKDSVTKEPSQQDEFAKPTDHITSYHL